MKKDRRRFIVDKPARCIFIVQKEKPLTLCQKTSPEFLVRKILTEQVQMGEVDIAAIRI
jgi:hypothetical protein